MVGSSIHIPKIIPVYILPYPEYPQSGKIHTTTEPLLRGFSKGRRTISNSLPSRPDQRSVYSFMLYSQPLGFMLTPGINKTLIKRNNHLNGERSQEVESTCIHSTNFLMKSMVSPSLCLIMSSFLPFVQFYALNPSFPSVIISSSYYLILTPIIF